MELAIDTTQPKKVIVSLKQNGKILTELVEEQAHGSQVLLPMIDKALKRNNLKITHVKSITVNPGPGSFTGTRVGVTVANSLGLALNIPVNGKKGKMVEPIYEKSKFDY